MPPDEDRRITNKFIHESVRGLVSSLAQSGLIGLIAEGVMIPVRDDEAAVIISCYGCQKDYLPGLYIVHDCENSKPYTNPAIVKEDDKPPAKTTEPAVINSGIRKLSE